MGKAASVSKANGPPMKLMLIIAARRTGPISQERLLERVRANASGVSFDVQLVDASKVYGPEHLNVAAEKAERAFTTGTNVADTVLVEFVRFASGRRQISDALALLGISETTERFAVCLFGQGRRGAPASKRMLEGTGLSEDNGIWGTKDEVSASFGLRERELATLGRDGWKDLVLERMSILGLGK